MFVGCEKLGVPKGKSQKVFWDTEKFPPELGNSQVERDHLLVTKVILPETFATRRGHGMKSL